MAFGALALGLLQKYWMQIAFAAAVALGWIWLDESWCNAKCERATTRATSAEQLLEAARKRATDLALLYAQTLDKIAAAVRQQKEADRVTFASLNARAQALPARPSIRLSDGAVRLWNDAARAANDQGPAAGSPASAGPVPDAASPAQDGGGGGDLWYSESDLAGFNVAAAAAYRDAVRHWRGAVAAFDAARAACVDTSSEGTP